MANKFSTVYRSRDGCVSASHHIDKLAADDELCLLLSTFNVIQAVICDRLDCDKIVEKWQARKITCQIKKL
jgi:hypothetical protein